MALERLTLRHFQIHRKLEVELSPACTTLVGASESGKSAVIRALGWLLFNQPRGDRFITHGETNATVRLRFDGGREALRRTGSNGNLYRLDGADYKAFGAEVPEDIVKALNVSPVSLARQFDAHFWLSKTAGEVSRELNAIVDLGVIDTALADAASGLRRATVELDVSRERLHAAKEAQEGLSWVPAFLTAMDGLEVKLERYRNESVRALALRGAAREAKAASEVRRGAARGLSAYAAAVSAGERALAAGELANGLRGLLSLVRDARSQAALRVPDLGKLERVRGEAQAARSRAMALRAAAGELRSQQSRREGAEDAWQEISARLGGVGQCPLCGGRMK